MLPDIASAKVVFVDYDMDVVDPTGMFTGQRVFPVLPGENSGEIWLREERLLGELEDALAVEDLGELGSRSAVDGELRGRSIGLAIDFDSL
jgi:hypothetical protein